MRCDTLSSQDLKKQTALRLAQKQQQKQTSYTSETLRDPVVQPLSEQHVTGFSPFVQPQSASFLNHGVPKAYPCQFEGTASPHSVHPNGPYHQQNHSFKPRVFNETYGLPNQMGFPVEQMDIRQLSPQNVQLVNAPRQVSVSPTFSNLFLGRKSYHSFWPLGYRSTAYVWIVVVFGVPLVASWNAERTFAAKAETSSRPDCVGTQRND